MSRFTSARALITSSLLAVLASLSHAQTIATPDGYAGYAGTTGGGNAARITVSDATAFKNAVNNNNPAVIIVNGMLNVGTVSIGSNKTIVGANANSGLYGGVIQVRGTNYIFQNLNFGPSGSDALEVSGGTKVFIHKCSFRDSSDELCSIVRQADFVTVSWSKFHFDNPDSHSFGHLIGNGDGVTADRGKLHVTLHHNWYGPGLEGRIPRVRFGHVHMYNNYINAVGTGYCIGVGVECNIRVENTHFDGVNNCWADYGGTSSGKLGWAGLKFTNGSTQPTFMPNTFPVFTPPYAFSLTPVDDVKAVVLAGAGNIFGGPVNNPPTAVITSPANGASFTAPASITINANASDSDGTIASVAFYQGSTLLGTDTTAPYSFVWNNVGAGNYSLTARATDNAGATTTSAAVNVTVPGLPANNPPAVSLTAPAAGASFTAPASITIAANASDSDGTISSVAFYQGTTLLGTDTAAPYTFAWNNVAAGNFTLTARATDDDGAVTTSAAVSISVGSGGGAATLQAEAASIGGGVTIDNNNAGFNGTGFANLPTSGGFLLFSNVNGGNGGTAVLAIRNALGATASRTGRLLVNGVAQNVTFNPTGSWTTWTTMTLSITLNSGTTNTLRLESSGQDLANIDEITVTPTSGSNAPPAVALTAPANGASFTAPASITVAANASDSDGTIASVAFYQGTTLLGTDTTAPYSYTWNNVAAGTYSLTARATDNAGATTASAAVNVTVSSLPVNSPPAVSLTAPAPGSAGTAPAAILINASASDSDGTIASVAFYQGTTLLGTDTTAPYSFAWNNVAAGTYSLTARATDNDGAMTTSTAVAITVESSGGTLPSPWQSSDIGAVAAAGTASSASGVFSIEGSGADIWGTTDEFRYVYVTAIGDCEIRARVSAVENTRQDAKAGVMIRESLAANSRHAMVIVTPSVGIHFQRRASTGGTSSSTTASATLTAPRWLRVVRSGNTFTAYHSADGATWTTISSQSITMGASVSIGLAVTSHVDGTLCTATFDNVTATP